LKSCGIVGLKAERTDAKVAMAIGGYVPSHKSIG
jgi:hypothetical protein